MQTSPRHIPQFTVALVIQLDADALLTLQVRNDGILRQRDLSDMTRDLQELDIYK